MFMMLYDQPAQFSVSVVLARDLPLALSLDLGWGGRNTTYTQVDQNIENNIIATSKDV